MTSTDISLIKPLIDRGRQPPCFLFLESLLLAIIGEESVFRRVGILTGWNGFVTRHLVMKFKCLQLLFLSLESHPIATYCLLLPDLYCLLIVYCLLFHIELIVFFQLLFDLS